MSSDDCIFHVGDILLFASFLVIFDVGKIQDWAVMMMLMMMMAMMLMMPMLFSSLDLRITPEMCSVVLWIALDWRGCSLRC